MRLKNNSRFNIGEKVVVKSDIGCLVKGETVTVVDNKKQKRKNNYVIIIKRESGQTLTVANKYLAPLSELKKIAPKRVKKDENSKNFNEGQIVHSRTNQDGYLYGEALKIVSGKAIIRGKDTYLKVRTLKGEVREIDIKNIRF